MLSRCMLLGVARWRSVAAAIRAPVQTCRRNIDFDEKGRAEENVYFMKQQQEQLLALRKRLMAKETQIIEELMEIEREMSEFLALKAKYKKDKDTDSLNLIKVEIDKLGFRKDKLMKTFKSLQTDETKTQTWLKDFSELEQKIKRKEKEKDKE